MVCMTWAIWHVKSQHCTRKRLTEVTLVRKCLKHSHTCLNASCTYLSNASTIWGVLSDSTMKMATGKPFPWLVMMLMMKRGKPHKLVL